MEQRGRQGADQRAEVPQTPDAREGERQPAEGTLLVCRLKRVSDSDTGPRLRCIEIAPEPVFREQVDEDEAPRAVLSSLSESDPGCLPGASKIDIGQAASAMPRAR
jgi:hypothetical protein